MTHWWQYLWSHLCVKTFNNINSQWAWHILPCQLWWLQINEVWTCHGAGAVSHISCFFSIRITNEFWIYHWSYQKFTHLQCCSYSFIAVEAGPSHWLSMAVCWMQEWSQMTYCLRNVLDQRFQIIISEIVFPQGIRPAVPLDSLQFFSQSQRVKKKYCYEIHCY